MNVLIRAVTFLIVSLKRFFGCAGDEPVIGATRPNIRRFRTVSQASIDRRTRRRSEYSTGRCPATWMERYASKAACWLSRVARSTGSWLIQAADSVSARLVCGADMTAAWLVRVADVAARMFKRQSHVVKKVIIITLLVSALLLHMEIDVGWWLGVALGVCSAAFGIPGTFFGNLLSGYISYAITCISLVFLISYSRNDRTIFVLGFGGEAYRGRVDLIYD